MKRYLVLQPLNEIILRLYFPKQGRLLASCRIEREKFYPGPGLEPEPLALRASALTTKPPRTSTDP